MDMIDFMGLERLGDISLCILKAVDEQYNTTFFAIHFGEKYLVFRFSETKVTAR